MHYTFVSPCFMLCRCEDLSDVCTILFSALSHVMQVWRSFWCMYHTFVSAVSCYVGVKTFLMYALYFCQPCLKLCRCEDLCDVCTILLSALSHVMQVWRSFWCMYHTFVSPVSSYVGVKTFLMYALYFCQPCLMLCRCEDLSDVCTILLSALFHAM